MGISVAKKFPIGKEKTLELVRHTGQGTELVAIAVVFNHVVFVFGVVAYQVKICALGDEVFGTDT